jgi:hypothetical protein
LGRGQYVCSPAGSIQTRYMLGSRRCRETSQSEYSSFFSHPPTTVYYVLCSGHYMIFTDPRPRPSGLNVDPDWGFFSRVQDQDPSSQSAHHLVSLLVRSCAGRCHVIKILQLYILPSYIVSCFLSLHNASGSPEKGI